MSSVDTSTVMYSGSPTLSLISGRLRRPLQPSIVRKWQNSVVSGVSPSAFARTSTDGNERLTCSASSGIGSNAK